MEYEDYAGLQQHDHLHANDDRERNQRQNHQRNGYLRKHRGEIRNWQRLPEEDAAIATFTM